MSKTATAYFSL